jgi:hypothetical protein
VTVTSVSEAEAGLAPVLAAAGAAVISIRPEAPTLEDLFLEVTA